jgi:hypothetical protein
MKRQPGYVIFTQVFKEGLNDYETEKSTEKVKVNLYTYKSVALQGRGSRGRG